MEKIKLNDGTIFDIVSGSDEYVNIVAESVDSVVKCFTNEKLKYVEILADAEEGDEPIARASFADKQMKNVSISVVDGGYNIVITFEDAVVDANEILNIILGGENA